MPWVIVNMLSGRSATQKLKLHQSISKAVAESLEISLERVNIQLVEMQPEDFSNAGLPKA